MKQWSSPDTLHLTRVKCCIYRQMKCYGTDLLKSKYKAISNLVRSQTRKDTAGHVTNLSESYFSNSQFFHSVFTIEDHKVHCLNYFNLWR